MLKIFLQSILGFALATAPLVACTCRDPTLEEAVQSHDTVFRGRAISARVEGRPGSQVVELEFEVDEVIKGSSRYSVQKLTTRASAAVCGLEITVPAEYLVLVNRDGQLWMCSGTQRLKWDTREALMSEVRTLVARQQTTGAAQGESH